ncbi:IclR family transcriptional regulator, KDG regulon repressor [Flexibacter flexilis DSM 6793]|uniref:IclR family transcriptional regulator, KDG regulon repressor n=1 Tax=Flexibacter flexilis DSM 6793 TaxID=927664 RepID=A0A1I1L742_9BACT|nr:IclR family transcriptional regulator [Flexibacter flexilis]SFC68831.1 IclR family transcriptional regulator, KDG regulon repressor [Flexibacter flexilis DSM 6793]
MILSVKKAMLIMEYVAQNGNNVRLQDIVDSLGMEKTTAHNFLKTLLELGYMEQDQHSPRYRLSDKMYMLMPPPLSVHTLKQRFRPILEKITELTGETSYLTVQLGTYMRHELKCDPNRSVRISLELGKELDIMNSALGNVFMAYSEYLRNTLLRNESAAQLSVWDDRLGKVLSKGYAEDFERLEKELNCIAVPVLEQNRLVAAIGVSGPSYRFQAKEMQQAAEIVSSFLQK